MPVVGRNESRPSPARVQRGNLIAERSEAAATKELQELVCYPAMPARRISHAGQRCSATILPIALVARTRDAGHTALS